MPSGSHVQKTEGYSGNAFKITHGYTVKFKERQSRYTALEVQVMIMADALKNSAYHDDSGIKDTIENILFKF